jgi:hypothetical protein
MAATPARKAAQIALPRSTALGGLAVLLALIFSKYVYLASLDFSYRTASWADAGWFLGIWADHRDCFGAFSLDGVLGGDVLLSLSPCRLLMGFWAAAAATGSRAAKRCCRI